jgi:predicted amidohydrolase
MPDFVVALLQMAANGNDQSANLKKADSFCRQAAEQGADIALMPELWNIGYTRFDAEKKSAKDEWQAQAISRDSDYVNHFRKLASELEMAIGCTYLEQWDGPPRNSISIIDHRGQMLMTYAKVHTCEFETMEASMTHGDDFHVCRLEKEGIKVALGAMICYDREHPESARILMLKGAEIILTPNACGLEELRIGQFRSRAFENACGVAMANYAAPDQNGASVAFGPDGEPLVEAADEEGVFLATFDLAKMKEYRGKTIWGNAYRRPHRYDMLLNENTDSIYWRRNAFDIPFENIRKA